MKNLTPAERLIKRRNAMTSATRVNKQPLSEQELQLLAASSPCESLMAFAKNVLADRGIPESPMILAHDQKIEAKPPKVRSRPIKLGSFVELAETLALKAA